MQRPDPSAPRSPSTVRGEARPFGDDENPIGQPAAAPDGSTTKAPESCVSSPPRKASGMPVAVAQKRDVPAGPLANRTWRARPRRYVARARSRGRRVRTSRARASHSPSSLWTRPATAVPSGTRISGAGTESGAVSSPNAWTMLRRTRSPPAATVRRRRAAPATARRRQSAGRRAVVVVLNRLAVPAVVHLRRRCERRVV